MVPVVRHVQVIQERELYSQVAKLAGLLAQLRQQLEKLSGVPCVRSKFTENGLDPAAAGSEFVYIAALRLFGQPPRVAAYAVEQEPALTLRLDFRCVDVRSVGTHV